MNITTTVPGLPAQFFTFASLGTLAGLTGATVAVTNTAARAFRWSPSWLGFAVAFALCEGLTLMRPAWTGRELVLAGLNACLVYMSASGASAAAANCAETRPCRRREPPGGPSGAGGTEPARLTRGKKGRDKSRASLKVAT